MSSAEKGWWALSEEKDVLVTHARIPRHFKAKFVNESPEPYISPSRHLTISHYFSTALSHRLLKLAYFTSLSRSAEDTRKILGLRYRCAKERNRAHRALLLLSQSSRGLSALECYLVKPSQVLNQIDKLASLRRSTAMSNDNPMTRLMLAMLRQKSLKDVSSTLSSSQHIFLQVCIPYLILSLITSYTSPHTKSSPTNRTLTT